MSSVIEPLKIMSTEPISPNSEDLAAYLDGELSRDDTLALEKRLASDEALRQELAHLQKAWDLLDVLPRAKADANFSTTTMSLAVEQLQRESATQINRKMASRLAATLGVLLLVCVGVGAGYLLVQRMMPKPEREIERDLHLLTNYDTYARLSGNFLGERNLEFLQLLRSSGLFVASDMNDPQIEPTTFAALPSEVRDEVIQHYQSIQGGGEESERIETMRQLAKQVEKDPARTDLLRTYDRYYAWLRKLPRAEIHRIEGEKDPVARLESIRQSKQQQNQDRFESILKSENLRGLLTRDDYKAYIDWLVEYISSHEKEFLSAIEQESSAGKRELAKVTDPRQRALFLYWLYVRRVGEQNALVPSQADFDKLSAKLSEEARKQFSTLELSDEQRRKLVSALQAAAVRARFSPPPSEEELAAVLKSLSPEEREQLEKLKHLDLRRELIDRFEKKQDRKNRDRSSGDKSSETKSDAKKP